MDIQNNLVMDQGNSNLPTSLDITPLLSRLDSLQTTPATSANQRNIEMIELDPYYHDHDQSRTKTRLFVVVVYGLHAIVAQLFALELIYVRESDEKEYEWIDASEKMLADQRNVPVLIFPTACADSLPINQQGECKYDYLAIADATKNFEITSCALIPTPAIRVTSSKAAAIDGEQDRFLTQRTVAVVLGTSTGHVFSRLLHAFEENSGSDNVAFSLRYEQCKDLNSEGMKNQLDGGVSLSRQPSLYQVLPRSKMMDSTENIDAMQDDFSFLNGDVQANMQVIHPSISTHVSTDRHKNKVTSVTFGRGDWKSCHKRRKKSRHIVMLNRDVVWVAYANGALVKMPSWKLFFSRIDEQDKQTRNFPVRGVAEGYSAAGNPALKGSVVSINNLVRSPLDVPPSQTNRLNPSGFDSREIDFDEQSFVSKMSMTSKMSIGTSYSQFTISNDQDYWGLLSTAICISTQQTQNGHQQVDRSAQALILGAPMVPNSTLPFSLQSSRVECVQVDNVKAEEGACQEVNATADNDDNSWASSSGDEQYGLVTGAVVGGTAALVRGAFGAALGAVRWGFGGGAAVDDIELDNDTFDNVDDSLDVAESTGESEEHDGEDQFDVRSTHGPRNTIAQRGEIFDLLPWPLSNISLLFSDVPRRFENAVVDPSSSLLATTDNLGRVVLIDLETQQLIRIWKGMRNVSLYFTELPSEHLSASKSTRSRLYLVVHAHKRGSIEVYRLRQGPRVAAAAVPPNECSVIECLGPSSDGSRVSSFLFETISRSNGSDSRQSILDYIVIDDAKNVPRKLDQYASQTGNSMQLNILVQLLAPDTNIQCNTNTILNTFKSIRALSDLGEALDVMSKSQKMEHLGAKGSRFHSQALEHCKSRLELAVEKENKEGSGMLQKSVISNLSSKISYHEKLIRAYDILNRYETRSLESAGNDVEEGTTTSNEWALEAISWISVAEGHDVFKPSPPIMKQDYRKPLAFSKFALSCSPPGSKTRGSISHSDVYLTEVKKDRLPILMRFFRPLLEDLFVFKVVNSVFGSLGIDQNFDIQQQYFGEWISTQASYDIAQSNLSGAWRPIFRWLQDLILYSYEVHRESPNDFNEDALKRVVQLQSLMEFCMEMENLEKAFLVAVICMDAVSAACKQIEERTYGKITAIECAKPWEILLRKLRVLLLVSFRLCGDVSPIGTGVNPLTIKSIAEFSSYYWVARDELSLSHDNQVLMALESACLSSSVAFYPSSSSGDEAENKKIILQSCSYTKKKSVLNPSGLTNDSNSRPLLFYLRDHAKCTTHLAAHRALILGKLWGYSPSSLNLLRDAISTLQIVFHRFEQFSMPTIIEFYQSWIRPTCHAIMFGFIDGHDGFKDLMSPLIDDDTWRAEFLTCAKKVLSLIIKCTKKDAGEARQRPSFSKTSNFNITEMWPPLQEDPFLATLTGKFRSPCLSSVELHLTILFAYELTENMSSLESISPSVLGLFLPGTLFSELGCKPEGSPEQYQLLDMLLLEHIKKIGPIVDRFELDSIEIVGKSMGIDEKYVRTRFFIESYRHGKDSSIDDLLASNSAYLDKQLFLNAIVHIICERLDSTVSSLKKSKSYRGVVSILDANTIRWVKEEAAKGSSAHINRAPVSLIATNLLVMRIKSMSTNISDETLQRKISDLSVMGGVLLKAVQSQEERAMHI